MPAERKKHTDAHLTQLSFPFAFWISAAWCIRGTGLEGDAIDDAKNWANIEAKFIEKIKPLIAAGTHSDYRGPQSESLRASPGRSLLREPQQRSKLRGEEDKQSLQGKQPQRRGVSR